jgi:two-component system, NtrC family, sensor histidine kinase HydH
MRLVAERTPETNVVKQFLRPEDVAWLLLFAILGFCQEDRNYSADIVLVCLAIVQVIEPKVPALSSPRGHIAVLLLKMLLCYLLVGYSHGINSSFYVIFLLPIISAATTLDLLGTVAFIALACVAYASFLFFVNWEQEYIPLPQWKLLGLRISFFPVVGLLVYQQARGKRDEMERTRAAAEQLAASNRSLRETQATLRRSERLAALGQLTAGLAHELRNPLGTIKASAEMLHKPSILQRPEIAEELAGYIATEVDRTNSLVSRFLDFARPLALHPQRADLRETVAQSVAQVQSRADARQVKVETDLPSAPVEFSFDAGLLSVALLNLLQNAIDASESGGSVAVSVRNNPESVRITVADHGAGIAEENLESIFNPFFTTKENGTGLGLALVAKIVDEHQGKITVRSRAGEGSVFEIVLPCPERI